MRLQQLRHNRFRPTAITGAAIVAVAIAGFACSGDGLGPITIDPPSGVAATLISPTSARVTWIASAQADKVTSYNVFRNGTRLSEVTGTAYTDNALVELTQYTYAISANGPSGIVSELTATSASATITAPDVTPPAIVAFTPSAGAANVAASSAIDATFSEAIDQSMLNATNFSVKTSGGATIAGAINYSATTRIAEFRPTTNFPSSGGVSVSISGVKDVVGNPMASAYTSSFTVRDELPPAVNGSTPTNGAINVGISSSIILAFSEQMNASTINATTLTLTGPNGAVSGAVAYDAANMRATLTPAASLQNSTSYTIKATGGMTDVAGNPLPPFSAAFSTIAVSDLTSPTVISSQPANGATNVGITSPVVIAFSEQMNASTINATTLTLTGPSGAVSGAVAYDAPNMRATFTPASLLNSTSYTIRATGGMTDVAGNALPPFNASFATTAASDVTPPTVISSLPADGTTSVAVDAPIAVTFSEAIDQSTLTASTMTLKLSGTSVSVPGIVVYNPGTNTGAFYPINPLSYFLGYTLTVSTGVKDLAGNSMAFPASLSFTTVPPPDLAPPGVSSISPANGAAEVPVGTSATIVFNRAMNAGSINSSTITVTPNGGSPVASFVTFDAFSNTAVLTPAAALSGGTTYTITVTTGVQGSNNMALPSQFTSTFRTEIPVDNTRPFVLRTNPEFYTTYVDPVVVTATFSEDMDPSTINSSTFKLSGSCGAVSYDQATRTATFTPGTPFVAQATYDVTVTTGAKDLAGNAMASDYRGLFGTSPIFDGTFTVGGSNAYTGTTCDGAINVHIVLTPSGGTLAADSTCTDCYLEPLNQLAADEIGPLSPGQKFARINNLVGYTAFGSLVIFDFGLDNGRSFHVVATLTSDKTMNALLSGKTLPKAGVVLVRP